MSTYRGWGATAEIHVLHFSDTHLGNAQYGLQEREKDVYAAFQEAIEIAIREHVDLVVHSGDFFDTARPQPQAIMEAIRGARMLAEKGIPLLAVMGDHDLPRRRMMPGLLLLRELAGVRVVGAKGPEAVKVATRSGEVVVAGIRNIKGPAARQRLLEALKGLRPSDEASILVLHQALAEASPFEYELQLGELPRGFSYYALGHIHVTRIYRLGDAVAAYPGSIEALRRDEARQQDKRYVLLASVHERGSSVEKIALASTRPQPVVEIRYGPDIRRRLETLVREITAAAAKTGKKPLLHLVVEDVPRGERRTLQALIERLLQGKTLAHRVQIVTRDEAEAIAEAPRGRVDPLTVLENVLRDRELAELAYRLVEILGDPAERESAALREAEALLRKWAGLERGDKA